MSCPTVRQLRLQRCPGVTFLQDALYRLPVPVPEPIPMLYLKKKNLYPLCGAHWNNFYVRLHEFAMPLKNWHDEHKWFHNNNDENWTDWVSVSWISNTPVSQQTFLPHLNEPSVCVCVSHVDKERTCWFRCKPIQNVYQSSEKNSL